MIETRGLRFRYPAGGDLAFADLAVPQGGRLVLRGPSGAGKSTWLALAAGLLTPGAGSIAVAGQPLQALRPAERDRWRGRHLGFLPQKLHLSDALTVQENLALPFYAAGLPVDRAAIARVLDALGVAPLAGRRPQHLSGGQAQRVALARAVLLSPRVLLADEPTASLDDAAADAALRVLDESASRCGATLAVATHDRRVLQAFPGAVVHEIGPGSAVASAAAP
ncbi:ABC transporter ATP-binding protein [Ramlibacter tataouinensis]|uniref:Candidate ABC transporter, ATP-binding component n=1 Tax=Ramlibacter tataouinensis (strain ATCC BAA-407 / DSM 14655 / LMG 21543 / TTB310) TaxID=365046 RepID=F5Y0X4_RAMTT|nr:ATP-binding cassette domain-containing protein [Ramlibacter tataouinensis]AEG92192.1 candidate ABC transporter, ATP-binding component [Ramlibacter tataouinensis TTB310]